MDSKKKIANLCLTLVTFIIIISIVIILDFRGLNSFNKKPSIKENFLIRMINNYNHSDNEYDYGYNKKFEKYFGDNIKGSDVKDLIDIVIENNKLYKNIITLDAYMVDIYDEAVVFEETNNISDLYTLKSNIVTEKNYQIDYDLAKYSSDGYITKIVINVKNIKNNDFEKYFGEYISGIEVKDLIIKIKNYDEEEYYTGNKNYIRILFDIGSEYTTNYNRFYLLTGISDIFFEDGNYLEDYIYMIKDNVYYYVNSSKYENGDLKQIVITDQDKKDQYK